MLLPLLLLTPPIVRAALETIQNGLQVRPRTVQVSPALDVTIYELAQPRELVELWMGGDGGAAVGALNRGSTSTHDPFGVVLWPGAHLAARMLDTNRNAVSGQSVLALGAGTGLECLMAARLGAARVLACDISPLALALLRHGAEKAGLSDRVETQVLDLFSDEAVPAADVLVCADLLYNPELATQVGRRCGEALTAAAARGSPLSLLVTDSQRFSGGGDSFTTGLLAQLPEARREAAEVAFAWQTTHLEQITGSGILIDEDQTNDWSVKFISQWPAPSYAGWV